MLNVPRLQSQDKFPVGLRNIGNTCYLNASIQCLLRITKLRTYFLKDKFLKDLNLSSKLGGKGLIAATWNNLAKDIYLTKMRCISPYTLKTIVGHFYKQFKGYSQQDCMEAISILLDGIHEDLNLVQKKEYFPSKSYTCDQIIQGACEAQQNYTNRNQSIITHLLYGLFKSEVKCNECGVISINFAPFSFISLPIDTNNKSTVTIYDCFENFEKEEELDNENQWNCSNCKKNVNSKKKLQIWTGPKILIIQLKRFKVQSSQSIWISQNNQKIDSFIDFPLTNLDLSSYIVQGKSEEKYNLFGVCNHYGYLSGGHYTAICKQNEKWYNFNDSEVREIRDEDVITNAAYILFYRKV